MGELKNGIREVAFHKIHMGDVEDPDLFVAEPIYQWQQTDAGKFVMEKSIPNSPRWERRPDLQYWGHVYYIFAEMDERSLTEYYLRWGNTDV
jgi:hypothetical protein